MLTLGFEPDLVMTFVTYATILLVKLLIMAPLTSRQRFAKQVFASAEDAKSEWVSKAAKVKYDDPDVERVRRAHLNDIENIVPFLLLGLIYCSVGPSVVLATWHFRVFAVARILHSVAYLNEMQPLRAIAWGIGYFLCLSMGVQILMKLGLAHI